LGGRWLQAGQLRLLQYDDYPRYCIKMATGSGKTKVIYVSSGVP